MIFYSGKTRRRFGRLEELRGFHPRKKQIRKFRGRKLRAHKVILWLMMARAIKIREKEGERERERVREREREYVCERDRQTEKERNK